MPNIGIFPLRFQDRAWGILLVGSEEPDWFGRHRDLFEVLAQEMALLAATAEIAKEARETQLREERARLKSDLLANVSHELRTPLGLVKGYLETLHESGSRMKRVDREEFLEVALAETHELEGLIDHMLLMSRMEMVGVSLRPRYFPLRPWLQRVIARYPRWDQDRISVERAITSSDMVFGDAGELATALGDLLQNALKYQEGRVWVNFTIASNAWGLTVSDQGDGVSQSELTRIFQRFYRSAAHAQSSVRGSGLGLSIVKRVAEAHGGSVTAKNLDGGGFAVTMTLPND